MMFQVITHQIDHAGYPDLFPLMQHFKLYIERLFSLMIFIEKISF